MNDSELSTVVHDSVAGARSATPVDQIVSRGRTMRARRRIPLAAGALAVAGGTALAVFAVLPSGQPGHPAGAQLAAWTVSKQANGNIPITVNQLKDPSGLQATLRADGLPADVNFGLTRTGHASHSQRPRRRCRPSPSTTGTASPSTHQPCPAAPAWPSSFSTSRRPTPPPT